MAIIDGINTDLWNINGHYASPQQDAQQILFPNYSALSKSGIPWNVVTAYLSTISGYPQVQNTLTPAEKAQVAYLVNAYGVGLSPLTWGTPASAPQPPNAQYAQGLGTNNWTGDVKLGRNPLLQGSLGTGLGSFGQYISNLGTKVSGAGR